MTSKNKIDLNADLGESFGAWKMGADEEMLEIVTSANIACGFHAGDPLVMKETMQSCLANGVNSGAHPAFDDLTGFGRRRIQNPDIAHLEASVTYQIGALVAIARSCGTRVTHVKFHGALANMASEQKALADCLVMAVRNYDPTLAIVAMAATELQRQTENNRQPVLREVYADRAYNDDGTLVSRNQAGAVLHDPEQAAERVLRMIDTQSIESINGVRIDVVPETVCVHGDTAGAVAMAAKLREHLEANGVEITPYRAVKICGS